MLISEIATSNEYKKGTRAVLWHRNVGPRGEQEGLAVENQQYKAGWRVIKSEEFTRNEHALIEEQRRCSEELKGKQCWRR